MLRTPAIDTFGLAQSARDMRSAAEIQAKFRNDVDELIYKSLESAKGRARIILADYFIIHRGRYTSLESAGFVKWNAIPWISWVVSAVLVYVIPWGLPSLNSLVLGALLYTVLMLVTGKNNEMLKREAN